MKLNQMHLRITMFRWKNRSPPHFCHLHYQRICTLLKTMPGCHRCPDHQSGARYFSMCYAEREIGAALKGWIKVPMVTPPDLSQVFNILAYQDLCSVYAPLELSCSDTTRPKYTLISLCCREDGPSLYWTGRTNHSDLMINPINHQQLCLHQTSDSSDLGLGK